MKATKTDLLAVVGNPISHSKSPEIHSAFAKQFNFDLQYNAMFSELDAFENNLDEFFKSGLGLNVTVPFKERAFAYADELAESAKRAGAVNTLIKKSDGKVLGENSDGIGLVNDITNNHQITLKEKRIIIVGAGGAVRGILAPFIHEGVAEITIVNRTLSRAQQLAKEFSDLKNIEVLDFEALKNSLPFDVIINGSSASLQGELPPLENNILKSNCFSYDMMYGKGETSFNLWVKNQVQEKSLEGVKAVDGLGMLVEQAAHSFYLWKGVKPKTAELIASLRQQLQAS